MFIRGSSYTIVNQPAKTTGMPLNIKNLPEDSYKVIQNKKSNLEFAQEELNKPGILKTGSEFFNNTGKLVGGALLNVTNLLASKMKPQKQLEQSNTNLDQTDQTATQKAHELAIKGDKAGAQRLLDVVNSHGYNVTLEDILPDSQQNTVKQIAGAGAGTFLEQVAFTKGSGLPVSITKRLAPALFTASKIPGVSRIASVATDLAEEYPKISKVIRGGFEGAKYGAGGGASQGMQKNDATINDVLFEGFEGAKKGFGIGAGVSAALLPLVGVFNYYKVRPPKAQRNLNEIKKRTGEIIQGKTNDIVNATRELSKVDPKHFTTYESGEAALNKKINTINEGLEKSLATDKRLFKVEDLNYNRNIGGKNEVFNDVNAGLNQLEEFYTKTNNVNGLSMVGKIKSKLQNEGLNLVEINNLAKLHGKELSGFNANGELASGLSRQSAENTRIGIKKIARDKFDNPLYESADESMSNLIKVRDQFTEMKEKVNILKQKIQNRSLGEKVGNLFGKVINLVGLGSPKGFVESFLPRGRGLKVLNALEIEQNLEKNLKRIQKLIDPTLKEDQIIANLEKFIKENKKTQLLLPAPKSNYRSQIFVSGKPIINIPDEKGVPMPKSQINSLGSPPVIATPDQGIPRKLFVNEFGLHKRFFRN